MISGKTTPWECRRILAVYEIMLRPEPKYSELVSRANREAFWLVSLSISQSVSACSRRNLRPRRAAASVPLDLEPTFAPGEALFDLPTFGSRNFLSRSAIFREIAAKRLRVWRFGKRNVTTLSEETRWRNARGRLVQANPVHPRRKFPVRDRISTTR